MRPSLFRLVPALIVAVLIVAGCTSTPANPSTTVSSYNNNAIVCVATNTETGPAAQNPSRASPTPTPSSSPAPCNGLTPCTSVCVNNNDGGSITCPVAPTSSASTSGESDSTNSNQPSSIGVQNSNLQSAHSGKPSGTMPTSCKIVGIGDAVTNCTLVPANHSDCLEQTALLAATTPYQLGAVTVQHPAFECFKQPFIEELDFRALMPPGGTTPDGRCTDPPNQVNSRPCFEPLRADPDYSTPTIVGGWQPKEGQKVKVACQQQGNDVFSQGYLRNLAYWYSNVWDLVEDPKGNVAGLVNDVWMGNQGWRGVPCHN